MKFCCEEFQKETSRHQSFVGGGIGVYPVEMNPTGQIEQDDDGTWNVNGCCGGGCYVLTRLRYCPWCGSRVDGS